MINFLFHFKKLVSLYLEHASGPLDLERRLVAHALDGPPKILDLQEVANEHEGKYFALPEVVLQLPEVLEYEIHVQRALELGQLQDVVTRQHPHLVREVAAVLQVVPEPLRPVVLHVEQVGLVHCVDRQRWRHAAALVAALPVAAQVSKRSATGGAPRLVVELIMIGYLRGVLPVGEAGPLQMIDLAIQLLLAPLQLLQLLQAFPRRIVDDHLLVLQLLALPRHHPALVPVLSLDLQVQLLLLLLLQLQFVLLAEHSQREPGWLLARLLQGGLGLGGAGLGRGVVRGWCAAAAVLPA